MQEKTVTLFTTPTCGYCKHAKEFFNENNIEFKEVDVAADQAAAEEMVKKSGQMGVPQIYVDDKLFIGFDKEGLAKELGL